jgi:hypothetical protein
MARWTMGRSLATAVRAVRSWRGRHTGDAIALDLSAMVVGPDALGGSRFERRAGWPRGVQEDDDVRWRWVSARAAPGTTRAGTRGGEAPRSAG